MMRPDDDKNTNDPNYYKYHCLVGHPIQKCIVFKDKVMELIRRGKFFFEEDKASVNQISIDSLQSIKVEKLAKEVEEVIIPILATIQFGSFDPIEVEQKIAPSTLHEYEYEDEKLLQLDVDDQGWQFSTQPENTTQI